AIRREILKDVREQLMAMAQEMELSQFNYVSVYQQAGDFAREIGLLNNAQEDYAQGFRLIEQIAHDDPNNDTARANMAVMHMRLGNVAWELEGDVDTARKQFEEARALRQEIADHPRSGEYSALQNRIALAYNAIDRGRL